MPRGVLESPASTLAKRPQAWVVMELRLLTLEYLQPREMSQPTELAASPALLCRADLCRADDVSWELGGLGGLHSPSAATQGRRQSPTG